MKKKIIRSKRHENTEAEEIIAELTDTHWVHPPQYLINKKTKEEYWAIVGGFAYPENRKPGFGVLVGVMKADDEEPTFKVLVEVENSSLDGLFKEFADICHEWGYDERYIYGIFGDPDRYLQSYSNFLKGADSKIYIAHATNLENPNSTQIYLQTLLSCGMAENGTKLSLGDGNSLRTHLNNLPKDASRIEEYPPVAALAYAIHSAIAGRVWERPAETPIKPFDSGPSWNDGVDDEYDDGLFDRDEPILE